MYETLSAQVEAEIRTYEGQVTLPSGITFDHRKTVKMISYHDNGKFFENNDESDIFWALGQKRKPHFMKKLDTDSKDYEVYEDIADSQVALAWIANIKLRSWFRESCFALDLNDIYDHCATFGSTLSKLTPVGKSDELKVCNLLYCWFDPTVANIVDSPIIELHLMTEYEIRAKKGWKNVEEILEKAELADNQEVESTVQDIQVVKKYKIWERTGEWKRKKDKQAKYWHYIFCGKGNKEVIILEEDIKKEDCLYIDFHIHGFRDRWLRVGVYERLFGLQQLTNEVVNYDREAQAIASLILLRSQDKALIGRNILEEAFSGMILDNRDLTQIGIDNRGLNEFLAKLMRYEQKADELCMTPDVVTGEKLPSNATYRGQALMTNVANDAFKDPRDRIGFKIADFIYTKKLPALMEKWNTEEFIEIAGNEDHSKIFDHFAKQHIVSDFIKHNWAKGVNPSAEELEEFKQNLEQEWRFRAKKMGIKGLFKGYKYKLKLNPTGENVNKEQRNQVVDGALGQLINVSPTAYIQLLKKHLEFNGISGVEVPIEEVQKAQETQNIPPPQPMMADKLAAQVNTY